MNFASNNGVRLHWQEQGSGTPILLIMGHRYSSAMWYPILPALAARHRVISFDNRGTGESDTTRNATVADLAGDAVAVMDAAGVAKAHVFGVSMGGVLAQELAIRNPQRAVSLILGCTGILSADKPRMPAIFRTLYYLPPGLLTLLLRGRRADKGYGSAASLEAIARDQKVLEQDKFVTRGVVAQAVALANYSVAKESIAALAMPALVLHGDEDRTVPIKWGEELANTLPNSRFVRFEGAGHNFLVAAPERAREVVLGFIDDVERKAGE